METMRKNKKRNKAPKHQPKNKSKANLNDKIKIVYIYLLNIGLDKFDELNIICCL